MTRPAMYAMSLTRAKSSLQRTRLEIPQPNESQVLIKVAACGVCRTDIHVIDGDLDEGKMPIILGHEVVGVVIEKGNAVDTISIGDRVGVPWLGHTCGQCDYCLSHRENLCDQARFTGYHLDGGYAQYTLADARFCFPIPQYYSDAEAAPLLCAGLVGFRSLRFAEEARNLGIYGFGAAAHIIAQVAKYQGRKVFAFTRAGDHAGQRFALGLGVDWVGDSDDLPPEKLDAALIFAPVGSLVVQALRNLRKGEVVVCAGIHMSDIPAFPYSILWGERSIRSVANLTRQDGIEFLKLVPQIPVRTSVKIFSLAEANTAIEKFRNGEINGAAVLIP